MVPKMRVPAVRNNTSKIPGERRGRSSKMSIQAVLTGLAEDLLASTSEGANVGRILGAHDGCAGGGCCGLHKLDKFLLGPRYSKGEQSNNEHPGENCISNN